MLQKASEAPPELVSRWLREKKRPGTTGSCVKISSADLSTVGEKCLKVSDMWQILGSDGGGEVLLFFKAGELYGKVQLEFLRGSGVARTDVMAWSGCSWLTQLTILGFYFRARSGSVVECCCAEWLRCRGKFHHPLVARDGTLPNA